MVKDVAADTAAIISLALEWGLYGMSVLMFGNTMLVLLYESSVVNRKMIVITSLFFVLSSSHAIIDIVRMNDGFVNDRETFPGGPAAFFGDATQKFFLIRSSIYVAQTLVADGVVIYRCYSVWRTYKVIILPVILWSSVFATGTGALNSLSVASRSGGAEIFVFAKWINSFFGSSLATNLISTALLAYRIWRINLDTAQYRVDTRGNPLMPVFRVVIDSGVLYSVTLIAALITFVTKSNSQYIVLDILMPIMPIAFYMIIIRLSRARKSRSRVPTSRSNPTAPSQGNYPLRPVQIHISQLSMKDDVEDQTERSEPASDSRDDDKGDAHIRPNIYTNTSS